MAKKYKVLTKEKIKELPLSVIATQRMKRYGKYTIEHRALLDYRDGLKPVHRRILWAMYKLNMHSTGGFNKASEVVGSTMGLFHPHGDLSITGAMVTISNAVDNNNKVEYRNTPVGLIAGQGNWGTFDSGAAAPRYIECRLSPFSDTALLNPEYLEDGVTHMIPNHTGKTVEPLFLPALMPVILLNDSSGIAVSVTECFPPFTPKSVKTIIKQYMKDPETPITWKDCLKTLQFNYAYGAVCVPEKSELKKYFQTGSGRVQFKCPSVIDVKKRTLTLIGVTPGFKIESFNKKMMSLDAVQRVDDLSGTDFNIVVTLKPTVPKNLVEKELTKLQALCVENITYKSNITIRRLSKDVETQEAEADFRTTAVPEIVNEWCAWRVKLEIRYLNNKKRKAEIEIARLKLLMYAITKLDIIFKILKSAVPDLDQALAKALKISQEDAKIILDLQTRRLSKLSNDKLKAALKVQEDLLKQVNKWLKHPEKKIAEEIDDIPCEC